PPPHNLNRLHRARLFLSPSFVSFPDRNPPSHRPFLNPTFIAFLFRPPPISISTNAAPITSFFIDFDERVAFRRTNGSSIFVISTLLSCMSFPEHRRSPIRRTPLQSLSLMMLPVLWLDLPERRYCEQLLHEERTSAALLVDRSLQLVTTTKPQSMSTDLLQSNSLCHQRAVKATGEVLSIKLSDEHNVCHEAVRQKLFSLHPDDPQIVVLKHNVWRFKGIIQVRRPDFILNVGCVHSVLVSGLLPFIIYLILFCKILAHR
ncbi:hypothetical protein LINPERHAP2_LOCUS29300, partial [Linum perenne]